MKAIVTGGEGFIGSRLVERLLDASWEVLIVDDYSTHDGPWGTWNPGARLQQGHVQEVILPRDFRKPDVIFHLAGKVGPVGVLKFKGYIAKDTIDAAYAVGDWAHDAGCPLIDVSTSEVYGSPDDANSEHTPKVFRNFSARSEYAIGKLAAENMLINRNNVDVRIIRPFNVTGARQRTEGGFVIPRFVQQAIKGEKLTVYQPGTQRRSFTHVDDIIDGMMLAWTKGKTNEVYNLGNPYNTRTMLELAQMVIAMWGKGDYEIIDPQTLHGKSFVEAPEKIPNPTKAMRELGFEPFRKIEQIVSESIAWEEARA
jgi:UDP-glucose 4-epimerase